MRSSPNHAQASWNQLMRRSRTWLLLLQARPSTRLSTTGTLLLTGPRRQQFLPSRLTRALLGLLDSAPTEVSKPSTYLPSHPLLQHRPPHLSSPTSHLPSSHLWPMHPSTHHPLLCNPYIRLLMQPRVQHLLSIPSPRSSTPNAPIHLTIYPSSWILSVIHSSTHYLNIHHLHTPPSLLVTVMNVTDLGPLGRWQQKS